MEREKEESRGAGIGGERGCFEEGRSGVHVKTRLASCFCSSCQLFQYGGCHTSRTYPGLVPNLRDGTVQETVIIDTGVAVLGPVDERKDIKFGARRKECPMKRITGTEWQQSDQADAQELWEELGREEEHTLLARFGKWAGAF